jgi:selenocysteine lyase/cysteine desulfurase
MHLAREAEIGGYEAADEAVVRVEHTYDAIASLLGCGRDEVALVENATRAWDMAFYALRFGPGDRILTGQAEYASNVIALLQVARRTGASVEVVPDDVHGQFSLVELRRMMDRHVKLIALTHVPSNGGLVNPASAVGAVARDAGVPFLLDACQSVGQMPLDVDELGCDMLAATGRKYLRAPRGTGFLYVRRRWIEEMEPPFLDLHAAAWTAPDAFEIRRDARRFETWEGFVAGRIGLGVAVDYALGWGLEATRERVSELARSLRAQLATIPGVVVHDKGIVRCGIVTFTKSSEDAPAVHRRLRAEGINTSISVPDHARFDMAVRGLPALVRASVHYYNTQEEVERFCSAVAGC